MTAPTNTFLTTAAIGIREDLSDVIYRIDPTDTPFMTMCDRETATATTHEWQTQALASAADNYQLEGDDAVAKAATPTVRLNNILNISSKTVSVSGTQRAVDTAGRDDELPYQETLAGLELKIDMERILVGVNVAKTAGPPRKTASVLSWIKTNSNKGTGAAADPATADGAAIRTDGTQRPFDENDLKAVLAAAWNAGGKPGTIMVGSFNKQAFSMFTGRAQQTEDTKAKKIVASVNYYDSDFGLLTVVPNRLMRSRDALVLQDDMWAVAYLSGRRMVSIPLAVTGDATRREVLSEYCLVARNEKSSGGVFDLTTA